MINIETVRLPTPYGAFHGEQAGSGAPVLLLHGGTASTREWRPVLSGLGVFAHCLAVDRLGCGDSERSAAGYSREAVVNSLLACADALGWQRFGVAGQSLGGFWALALAFAAPSRISRLVLANAAGGPLAPDEREERRRRTAAGRRPQVSPATPEARQDGAERALQRYFADPRRAPPSYRADAVWQMERADPAQQGALSSEFERMAAERYDTIACPVLVVWGEADAGMPAERGRRLAAAIPGARYAGLSGCGHLCQMECPDAFIAAVGPFLRDD